MSLLLVVSLFITSIAFGCSDDNQRLRTGENTDDIEDTGNETDTGNPGSDDESDGCEHMDILFVIDNSGSMAEEQENLIDNFPRFIELIEDYKTPKGNPVDFHVGVTSTGVSRKFKEKAGLMSTNADTTVLGTTDDGVLLGQSSCGISNPWLEGPQAGVADSFTCAAELGTKGSSTEMPLAAMELALGQQSQPGFLNHGFYRDDDKSLLVVIIITDEDDCSIEEGGVMQLDDMAHTCVEQGSQGLYTAERSKQFIDDLTGGEGRYVMVAIAGTGPESCQSEFGNADFADRLRAFIDNFGSFGVFGNICAGDLTASLNDALNKITLTCDSFPAPI